MKNYLYLTSNQPLAHTEIRMFTDWDRQTSIIYKNKLESISMRSHIRSENLLGLDGLYIDEDFFKNQSHYKREELNDLIHHAGFEKTECKYKHLTKMINKHVGHPSGCHTTNNQKHDSLKADLRGQIK